MEIKIISKSANHADSMRILKENNLQPLTYQEALANGKELVKAFKGAWKWFYLSGTGKDLKQNNGVYAFDANGRIEANVGNDIEHKVYVWSGNNPLSLCVYSGYDAAYYGRRFVLYADYVLGYVAPVVVGKPLSKRGLSEIKHKHRYVCECGKVKS